MIKPTIGRVVWYHPIEHHAQPYAAMVSYVHSDSVINLGGFTPNGIPFSGTSVFLWDGEGEAPQGPYAEWVPYQKQVAAGQIAPTLHR